MAPCSSISRIFIAGKGDFAGPLIELTDFSLANGDQLLAEARSTFSLDRE